MRIIIPGVIIFVGFTILIGMAVVTLGIPEIQVHQVLADEFRSQEVKVQGVIAEIHSEVRPLRFTVRDRERPDSLLEVEIDDVRPDIFKVGNDVAVIGTYDAGSGRLAGEKIFTKCPSKYEAEGAGDGSYGGDPNPVAAKKPANDQS